MNRLFWLALVLGTAGCVTEVDDSGTGGSDDQAFGLEAQRVGDDQRPSGGGALDPSQVSPAAEDSDPNGPTPYPWDPALCDDPNGGPTPYPWKDGTQGTDQSSGSGETGSGAEQQETSKKNN